MKLNVTEAERRKLMRTLRWVITATMMDVHEESMLRNIIERLKNLNSAPKPPKVNP